MASSVTITTNIEDGAVVQTDVVEGITITGDVAVGAPGPKGDQGDPGAPGADGQDGVMASVVAGNNIDVDATDPANPIVSVEALTLADITDITATATELNYTDGVTSSIQSQLNAKQALSEKDAINGYPGLDGSGKINPTQLPATAITETFVVISEAAMLALTAQTGDVAVRTDVNKSFILTAEPASTLANWQELLSPTDQVASVFGRQGTVTAQNGDYNAGQVTNTPAGSIASTTVQGALNELDTDKEASISAGTTGQYWRGDKTFQTLDKSAVGLGNVDNTSDATKNSATATLTNKTIIASTNVTEEITAITSSATPTPTGGSLRNAFDVTALATGATFAAPSGTPAHRNKLWITIKDNGGAQTLAWNSAYVAGGVALPTTTVAGKILNLGFIYNTNNSLNKWQLVASAQEA